MNLKEATAALHSKAEKMEFNQKMFRGELTAQEYLMYLCQQLSIFTAIEYRFPLHTDLMRSERISEDIHELLSLNPDLDYAVLDSTADYRHHLCNLKDPMPHIYLNYLALAYGGQMMKSKVPGSGKMYDFDNMMEAIGSIRAVQSDDWADEVNIGFQHIINILDELQTNA